MYSYSEYGRKINVRAWLKKRGGKPDLSDAKRRMLALKDHSSMSGKVLISLDLPSQVEIDDYDYTPTLSVDVDELIMAVYNGEEDKDEDFEGGYFIDPMDLFRVCADNHWNAECTAQWLEVWAEQIRKEASEKKLH